MDFSAAQEFALATLREGLSPTLFYHGLHHTLDVAQVALELAAAEGVTDPETLTLLHTAALYHDAGFLYTYQHHEEAGCKLVAATLPDYDYSPRQVAQIQGLIRATRYPQTPQTHLEQILCDADLDYLGRPDFEPISTSLYEELCARQMVGSEHAWFELQARFLSSHHYWTATALHRRAAPKQAQLAAIAQRLAEWPAS
jgi:uncharacterized protein